MVEPAQAGDAQAIALDPDAGDHAKAVEVPVSLEPGEPGPALLHPLEEALEGMIEALERPPLNGHRHRRHVRQGLAAKGQGLRLIEVGERLAGLPVAVDAFFQRRVVETAL